MREGDKGAAIQIVMKAHGIQHKEAKDAVDAYVASQPELQQAFVTMLAKAKAKLFKILLVTAVLIVVCLFLIFAR